MKVWKITLMYHNGSCGGSYYESNINNIADCVFESMIPDSGEFYTVACEDMSREEYEELPEFEGF